MSRTTSSPREASVHEAGAAGPFDHADDQVTLIANSNKKGWLPAYRDSVMFKVAYSYGLRFNELRHLQTVDFSRNPHAASSAATGRSRSATARRRKAHRRNAGPC